MVRAAISPGSSSKILHTYVTLARSQHDSVLSDDERPISEALPGTDTGKICTPKLIGALRHKLAVYPICPAAVLRLSVVQGKIIISTFFILKNPRFLFKNQANSYPRKDLLMEWPPPLSSITVGRDESSLIERCSHHER